MRKESTGRRDTRGERGKEKREPSKRRSEPSRERSQPSDRRTQQKPLQRYSVADKSEAGWTKPDGKPVRKRVSKKDDSPAFERKRPSREIGTGRDRDSDFKPKRSDFSTSRGTGDFKDSRSREDKPTRRSGDDFKPRGSRDDKPFGSREDFKARGSRSDKPFGKPDRAFKKDDDFKPRTSRSDKPFRKSDDDFKPRTSRSDSDFKTRGSRSEKSFDKPDRDFKRDDDFKPKRRDFSEERGKSDFKTSSSREDKPFRKSDDDFKPRPSRSEKSFDKPDSDFKPRVSRSERSFDKPDRNFKKDDDFKPKRRDFSEERGKSDFKDSRSRDDKPFRRRDDDEKPARREYASREKKERPPRGKSFLKSGTPDDKPFKRFEKDFSRDEKRTDKFKLKARPAPRSRRDDDRPSEKTTSEDGTIRLNRYIANAGICSRREADNYISAGLVSVNGEIVSEVGTKVFPSDDVRYNGERLKAEKNVYILLNKPKDYITTSDDPDGRKTVMELIAKACKERVYPVGRLDRSTTGILLFTNDGDLAKKLTHPSSNIKKVYHVELDKTLKKNDFQKMIDGIELEDGVSAVDEISYDAGGDKKQVGVQLHSGKNRIVRRMFEQLGYEVRKLDRVVFAGLTKKDLPRGRWRLLSETEVGMLKMQVGKASKKGKVEKDKDQLKLF